MPENNYGVNAAPKNAIDYLYFERQYKPLGFVNDGNTPIPRVGRNRPRGSVHRRRPLRGTEAMASSAKAMLDELRRLTPVAAQSI